MAEIWKDIKGYEGLYQVSNRGYVKNTNKILKNKTTKKGYNYIHLSKNNIQNDYYIHRLVAQTFIPNLENKETVNHKNGIKTDNKVENLEWATRSENTIHAYKNGLMKNCIEKKHRKVLMSSLDNKPLLWFDSIKEASLSTNAAPESISKCCKNHKGYYSAGGYKWEYYKEVNNEV